MNYSAIRAMGRRSPKLIGIVMSSTAPRSYISAHQQQTVSTTGCRHRRRVRNRDEQECREVHTTTSHRLLRLPVRQTTHATVLLRLCRQIRRTTAVSVLRDGHRLGHTLHWLVKVSMDSSEQIVAHTTSDTDHSGFRPNVVTNTKTTVSGARIAGRPWTVTESCCFARKAFDKRTPGLFKVEWCGDGFVGLCSKDLVLFWCHRQV